MCIVGTRSAKKKDDVSVTKKSPKGRKSEVIPKFYPKVKFLSKQKGVCIQENKGSRDSMEDTHIIVKLSKDITLYAVLDGHGGKNAATHFAKVIPQAIADYLNGNPITEASVANGAQMAFLREDEKWFNDGYEESGTTFTGALVTPDKVYLINLGDSRTIVIKSDDDFVETRDHKPNDPEERKRISANGGEVVNLYGTYRVNGVLGVARALGGYELKCKEGIKGYSGDASYVSPVPDVLEVDRESSEQIILACDGLFDVVKSEEAVDMVKKVGVTKACKDLAEKAFMRHTKDNVTVMVVDLLET